MNCSFNNWLWERNEICVLQWFADNDSIVLGLDYDSKEYNLKQYTENTENNFCVWRFIFRSSDKDINDKDIKLNNLK